MAKEKIVLALDTSNYTTSLAALTLDGELLANIKRLLTVKEGERGLRQSDALFAHTVNLPVVMNEIAPIVEGREIVCVGVSDKPRNQDGSYMPCFLAGVSVAVSLSVSLGVPLYRFSHQCGHIMAAVYSSGREDILKTPFAAFHVSGGTTELVRVSDLGYGFSAELLGGTADLNAGQIIDRIGVRMGLPFPAGQKMEELALRNDKPIPKRKISVKELSANLSGLENMAAELYKETEDKPLVAAFVLDFIGRTLIRLSEEYENRYGRSEFIYAGGVMSNSIIKGMLGGRFNAFFAEPRLSSDNAVGVAALALRAYKRERDL